MFPSSSIGLSANLDYKLPPSMADNSRMYSVAIAPDGLTSVSTNTAATWLSNTAGSSPVNQFNSQMITFTIPSGSSRSVYLDTKETYLSFRLTINTTASGTGTAPQACLLSSAQSFFDQLNLVSNNVPIETINQYGILANMLLNSTVSYSEKVGAIATGMGCDTNSSSGVDLPITNAYNGGITYYNFCIPLLSVIGLNGGDKLFPIGSIGNLQLQMTTSALLPIVSYQTATTATGTFTATLDNFTLNMKMVDIGSAQAIVDATIPDGKIFIKAQSWVTANSNIPANTQGQVNAFFQIRNSSVKSVFFQNSQATSALTPNGYYDAVNFGVTQFNVNIAGLAYPQFPLDPTRRPGQAVLAFLSGLGMQGDLRKNGGNLTRSAYGSTLPNITGLSAPDSMLVTPAAGVRAESAWDATTSIMIKYPCMHWLGVDLEKSSGVLFQGVNTRSTGIQANFYFGNTTNGLANAVTSFGFALIDCVLMIDSASQSIQSFV